jgi:hypothetical protein
LAPSHLDHQRWGRLGGLTTHSRHDSRKHTEPARAAFRARFELEVDPNSTLPLAERLRRAELARRAYFLRLALKSAASRRARAKEYRQIWVRRDGATPTNATNGVPNHLDAVVSTDPPVAPDESPRF